MSPLLRALSAESLKLRHTLALRMCLIAPAVVVALFVAQMSLLSHSSRPPTDSAKAWLGLSENILTLWSLVMLPLFVTLQSALLASIEHSDRHWKHLLALPVARRVHYLAKLLVLIGMVVTASALLALFICIGGALLMLVQPAIGLAGAPPLAYLAEKSACMLAASLLMVALQNWIAIRWNSFTVAVSFGMTATVIGMMVVQSKALGPWYPWSMPTMAISFDGAFASIAVAVALIGGVVATAIGLIDFERHEFS